jgi:hypothetical protein
MMRSSYSGWKIVEMRVKILKALWRVRGEEARFRERMTSWPPGGSVHPHLLVFTPLGSPTLICVTSRLLQK